eukprot:sb/3479693/
MEENYSLYLVVVMALLGALPSILPLIIGSVTYHHSRKWMYCRLDGTKTNLMTYIWSQNCIVYFPAIFGVVAVYIAVQMKANQARRMSMMFREECKKEQEIKVEKATGIGVELYRVMLWDLRITILLLCIFLTTKLPIKVLKYAHETSYLDYSIPSTKVPGVSGTLIPLEMCFWHQNYQKKFFAGAETLLECFLGIFYVTYFHM